MSALGPLAPSFATTRDALRTLACYAISPARKARTGRIGLRPFGPGFATPPFDDGTRIVVDGVEVGWHPGEKITITTLAAAATFLGVDLSPDPGVGHDLPPFVPEAPLAVDPESSFALGRWYAFGQSILDGYPPEAQLWPEHFDLASTIDDAIFGSVNIGFSPGDTFHADPYCYVGPHDTSRRTGEGWNAPFGAYLGYGDLLAAPDPTTAAQTWIAERLAALPPAAPERDA